MEDELTTDVNTEQVDAKPNFWVGLGFFLVVIIGVIVGSVKVYDWLQDEQRQPLQKVVFSGKRIILNDDKLESYIRKHQTGSFFALDVNEVHALVEDLPWVYRASVRKRWPNQLHVYLVEQQPMALWNDDLLLNDTGDVFDGVNEYERGFKQALPQLFGPGGSERTALSGLKAMQTILGNTDVQVEQLFLSERFAWRVKLTNNIQLNLGRQEFIDRLQRFIDVYPLLLAENKRIKYIDLRYDTGLAVGWLEQEESPTN